jgi:hypothetical protein
MRYSVRQGLDQCRSARPLIDETTSVGTSGFGSISTMSTQELALAPEAGASGKRAPQKLAGRGRRYSALRV